MLACFENRELEAWKERGIVDERPVVESFARRAWFLGVGALKVAKINYRANRVSLELTSPYKGDTGPSRSSGTSACDG